MCFARRHDTSMRMRVWLSGARLDQKTSTVQTFAVLGIPPVDSPESALKVAIAARGKNK
jgi:hypothetical protein